ncbi:lipoprotein insertase outer membrane protein LolB [Marinimicrobium agarilyticum]|uniref:lipoprotein insertase outer membrane protein LolB n=1 Tax=Marinimicrobium agarilyticum TaxID=306546 RepID=UPI0004207871|nr:lipoprotein insertase outer membrane protein LolB [Marinimicrobium agarilyticum]
MRHWRLLLGAAIVALAAGCAQQPSIEPVENWDAHRAAASALHSWTLSGKLGVRVPDDSGSARLRWKQQQEEYRIDLSGPFGQGRVIIDTTESGVRLRQGGEPPLEASSAEDLLWQATGWRLPVEDLTYWVRGIPAPGSDHVIAARTENGLVRQLEQSGWTLHYEEYQRVEQTTRRGLRTLPLPGRIVAERGDTRLTLIVYDWSLPNS